MEFVNVEISKIRVPEVRMTAVYDEDLLEQFKSSIATAGQLEPIIVMEHGDIYHLVDGLHRLEEARERGDKTIPSVVYSGDEKNALLYNIVSNRLRGKTRASEMVMVIDELVKTYEMDSDQICKETGLTRDYVEKLWKIAEASPSVKEALDQEIIGIGIAFELARLPAHIQQDEIMATAQIWRYTVKDLREFVSRILAEMEGMEPGDPGEPAQPSEPYAPRPLHCQGCKGEAQPHELRPVMLCPACFGKVWNMVKDPAPVSVETE